MAGTKPLTIGADASCSDGAGGKVISLIMDPRARSVTHLVVSDRQFRGRLVPLGLVDVDATTGKIRLGCTVAELGKLGPASRTVPLQDNEPFYPLPSRSVASGLLLDPPSATYDSLPPGEVAVRGGDHVRATDGSIGQVQGLVIDSGSHHVTHVLLQEGHVFGRKVAAIPMDVVTGVSGNDIQLNITRRQVKDLPSGWHRSPG